MNAEGFVPEGDATPRAAAPNERRETPRWERHFWVQEGGF